MKSWVNNLSHHIQQKSQQIEVSKKYLQDTWDFFGIRGHSVLSIIISSLHENLHDTEFRVYDISSIFTTSEVKLSFMVNYLNRL